MRAQLGLVLQQSTIPEAGRGLFFVGHRLPDGTMHDTIKPGEIITYYSSPEMLTHKEIDAKYGEEVAPYGFCLSRNRCMDSASTLNFPGRLLNDGRSRRRANVKWGGIVKFDEASQRYLVPLRASRTIRVHSDPEQATELFIAYGKQYWNHGPRS